MTEHSDMYSVRIPEGLLPSVGQPRIRDVFPTFRILEEGSPEWLEQQAKAEEERRAAETAQRDADALFATVQAATPDGTLRTLLDMHKPRVWLGDVECQHCTTADEYGHHSPLWPCVTVRVIAGDVGVDLPERDEDDW